MMLKKVMTAAAVLCLFGACNQSTATGDSGVCEKEKTEEVKGCCDGHQHEATTETTCDKQHDSCGGCDGKEDAHQHEGACDHGENHQH